jgi:methionyl-tRNA formyltransferase
MRVIFIGNGYEYSIHFLQILVDANVDLAAIVAPIGAQSDEARAALGAGRRWAAKLASRLPDGVRRVLVGSFGERFAVRVAEIARHTGAALCWPESINDPALLEELSLLDADLAIMAGFNQILKPAALRALPPVINIHPSLLPAFRGPNPEYWIIAHQATESGVTLHLADAGIDTGPILAQQRFAVEPWLTGGELHQRAMRVGGELLRQVLASWDGERTPRHPPSGVGSYQGRVDPAELALPFEGSVQAAYAAARAITPWAAPYLWVPSDWWAEAPHPARTASASRTSAPQRTRVQLRYPAPLPGVSHGPPGTLLRTESNGVGVACQDGTLYFGHVQPG